ncbi:MAG: BatD family protein [Planctomycetota bacterium]
MKSAKHIIPAIAVTAVLAAGASAQVRIAAQIDAGRDIYVGEGFNFYIVIQGSENTGKVDLQPLQQYNPQSIGSRKQSSLNIINGKTTRSVTTIMTYTLTAGQAGRLQIPPLTVEVEGKNYQTNPVAVNIIKPGTTDQLDLEVILSQKQCYVGQPVIITVKFYVSTEIGDPQFNIPAFNSDAFYIEEPDVSNPQAKLYRLNSGIPITVTEHKVAHKNKDWVLVSFSKVLIPKRSGKIAIEPSSVSANVAVGRTRSRDPFDSFFGGTTQYRRFMVTSEPLELQVLPLPEEDKPAQFYGLVGQYTISASATPTKVNVGDPITLTIIIGGSKYLKPVQWPALENMPALAANFKIPAQKASPTIDSGLKVFTQTIRANNDQVTEIPPIPLAYFDADQGRYVTAATEPIKLEVAPTKILTNADLEGSDFVPINREIEAIKKGLSANYEDLETLNDMSFSPLAAFASPGYAVLWGVPLLGLISSFIIKALSHTNPEKIAARRRRQACGKALGKLKKLSTAETAQQNEQLVSIMKNYVGEKFDRTAGSLTPDDCYDAIIAATDDTQSADEFRAIIAGLEAGRYSPTEIKIDSDKLGKISELIRSIEKNSRK